MKSVAYASIASLFLGATAIAEDSHSQSVEQTYEDCVITAYDEYRSKRENLSLKFNVKNGVPRRKSDRTLVSEVAGCIKTLNDQVENPTGAYTQTIDALYDAALDDINEYIEAELAPDPSERDPDQRVVDSILGSPAMQNIVRNRYIEGIMGLYRQAISQSLDK